MAHTPLWQLEWIWMVVEMIEIFVETNPNENLPERNETKSQIESHLWWMNETIPPIIAIYCNSLLLNYYPSAHCNAIICTNIV